MWKRAGLKIKTNLRIKTLDHSSIKRIPKARKINKYKMSPLMNKWKNKPKKSPTTKATISQHKQRPLSPRKDLVNPTKF